MIKFHETKEIEGLFIDNMWCISFLHNRRDQQTVCTITLWDDKLHGSAPTPSYSFVGVAFCSAKDAYDPVKGMRLALYRALHNSTIDPKFYSEIWDEWVKRFVTNQPCKSKLDFGPEDWERWNKGLRNLTQQRRLHEQTA